MPLTKQDAAMLDRAIEWARVGIGLTSPNPCVGAVLADAKGRIVGEGSHNYERKKHAEILALEKAGKKAKGSTLYINLEPCCHKAEPVPAPTRSLRRESSA